MTKSVDHEPTFGEYLRVFKRRSPLFFGIIAGVLLIGFAIAFRVPALYASRGLILAEVPDVPDKIVRSTVPSFPEERVRIITQRVLTRDNLAKVIADNGLYPELAESPAEARQTFRDHTALSAEDPEILEKLMGTTRGAGSLAFSVAFLDPSPTVARDVADDLVALYLKENQAARREQASQTSDFLRQERDRLGVEIAEREQKLADFKEKNAGALPELANSNLQMQDRAGRDLDAVEQEIRSLRERVQLYSSELAQLSPQATVLNDQGGAILGPTDRMKMLQRQYMQLSSAYSPDHPDVLKVRRELEALSASTGLPAFDRATLTSELAARTDELKAARDRYSNDHPDVLRLEKTVDGLKAALASTPRTGVRVPQFTPDNPVYIQREVQLRAANVDLQAALERRDQVRVRLDNLEGRLTTSPDVEREYTALNRGYQQLVEQYNDNERNLREAEASLNLEQDIKQERFTVLEQPTVADSPSKPNRVAVLLLAFALAIGLGVGGVALAERSDDTVRHPRDVTQYLEIPPLVAIPYVANKADASRRTRNRLIAVGATFAWACSIFLMIITPV